MRSKKARYKNWLLNMAVTLASTIFSLVVLELVLRLASPHDLYHSLVPSLNEVRNQHTNNFFPGIDTVSHFTVNEYGYRSPSYFAQNRYGILAIGGSTTQCISLSDEESWPWILENRLNQSAGEMNFTVGNVGVPSLLSQHHWHQLKYLEPQFENIKMILMLVGFNDLGHALLQANGAVPTLTENKVHRRSFVRLPRKSQSPLHQQTELYMHLRDAYNQYRANQHDFTMEMLHKRVTDYEEAVKSDTLPDLSFALDEYDESLRRIAVLAKKRNLRLVFITQPVLWHKGMNEYEEKIGSVGAPVVHGKSYSFGALALGMEMFNNTLIQVAKEEQVELIDLAHQVPSDTSIFYDWCHYHAQGSEEVARIIHAELTFDD